MASAAAAWAWGAPEGVKEGWEMGGLAWASEFKQGRRAEDRTISPGPASVVFTLLACCERFEDEGLHQSVRDDQLPPLVPPGHIGQYHRGSYHFGGRALVVKVVKAVEIIDEVLW